MAALRSHNPYHNGIAASTQTATAIPAPAHDDGFAWIEGEEPTVEGATYRMLMCGLPVEEISDNDVADLFKESIGPVKSAKILYTDTGLSIGIALVTFHRAIDCKRAHIAFDGKMIDAQQKITLRPVLDLSKPIPPSLASIIVPQIPSQCFPQPILPASTSLPTGPRSRLAALNTPRAQQVPGQTFVATPVVQSTAVGLEVPMMVEEGQLAQESFDTDADFIQLGGRNPTTNAFGGRAAPPLSAPRGPAGRVPGSKLARNSSHPYQALPQNASGGSRGAPTHPKANGATAKSDGVNGVASGSGQGKSLLDRMQVSLADRIGGKSASTGPSAADVRLAGSPAGSHAGNVSRPANGRVVSENDRLIAVQKARLAASQTTSLSQRAGNPTPAPKQPHNGNNAHQQSKTPNKAAPSQTLQTKSKPVAAYTRFEPKTQEQLDNEMEVYNRQRKFGGDAMDTT